MAAIALQVLLAVAGGALVDVPILSGCQIHAAVLSGKVESHPRGTTADEGL